MKIPMQRNGPNGIAVFRFTFLVSSKYEPYIPPTKTATKNATTLCLKPRRIPDANISLTSPKPKAPVVMDKIAKGALIISAPISAS